MRIELKGGPFDGHIIADAKVEKILIVESGNGSPRPIYRCAFCECCAHESETVDYQFIGYENFPLTSNENGHRKHHQRN